MMAAALFGSVVVVSGFALVAWHWWLVHLGAIASARARDIDTEIAKLRTLEGELGLLARAVKALEVRTAGRG